MKKFTVSLVMLSLTVAVLCSAAWSAQSREVRLGSYLLLRVRCPAAGLSIDERANVLQQRANDLLRGGKTSSAFTVKTSGEVAMIYADDTLFVTVFPCDAKANETTVAKLADAWTKRLRDIFPKSTPDKPGVGRPRSTP